VTCTRTVKISNREAAVIRKCRDCWSGARTSLLVYEFALLVEVVTLSMVTPVSR
jgi:hypothetical protein